MPRRKTLRPLCTDSCAFCLKLDDNPLLGNFTHNGELKLHTNCIFAASGLSQDKEEGTTDEDYIEGFHIDAIKREIRRGRSLICSYCRNPGACVGCVIKSCPCTFHLPCVSKAKGVTIFSSTFPSYCRRHAPKQNLENWLKHCTEVPACCVCLFPMLPEENKSEPPPTVTKCKNKETDPPHSKVFTTPVNNRRLPRRTCMAMSTPKRVRVSVELSVRRLSTSNSSWEVSDLSVDPEPIPDEPTISSTTLCSSSRIHPALSHLPDWLKVSLSDKPDKQQLAAYDAWTHNSIHGLCCPKAWMHRSCIAGYAASAALHYLKCPYCAEKDVFIRSIIDAGIWVPDRDAAWELEPGAYADLAPADNSIASGSSESNSSSSPPSTSNPTPLQDSMQQNSTLRRSERRSVRPRKMSPSPDERHSPSVVQRQKSVLSLVWNSRQFGMRGRGGVIKSRRPTQPAIQKTPPDSFPRRGNPRKLSLFPRNMNVDSPFASQLSETHRLRQATLGSFLANMRVSSPT
ncbi:G2/M phase-specific E3 ubiquitin-protein ligase [Clonorchis sinensis]|uniref:G2/M phase-specific E3 ubiquitin-protein ligase n=1 Tax=Clonorchis sinensis TaxID=79923 RepID=A0A8T1MEE1_CLOSI|nr:G2/M phase-specific E3 ubiquitin-protein ligase [Clonorchis sinensis]